MVDIDPLYTNGTYLPPDPGKKTKRKLLILAVLVVLLLIGSIAFALQHKHTQTGPQPITTTKSKPKAGQGQPSSNPPHTVPTSEGTPTTQAQNTGFTNLMMNDDNPNHIQYNVTSGSNPIEDWYIIHVTAKNSYGTFNQIAVIHHDNNGNDDVIAGPDTSFPRSYLESQDVPREVINQLPVYDDTTQ